MSSDEQVHAYARQERAPLHRWVENMTATARRQATSVAAAEGRQWVNRTLEFRPARGEIRAWLELVLDERRGLHNRVEALTKENDAVRAQRDEALEGYREDVERFRAHVQLLDEDRTRRAKERDEALDALELSRAAVAHFRRERDELRAAYGQAEGERNELARRVGVGRASCPHTPKGGA